MDLGTHRRAKSRLYRRARVQRLFEKFEHHFARYNAKLGRAAGDAAEAVLAGRRSIRLAIEESARAAGIGSGGWVLLLPHDIVLARAVEAIVLAGRPKVAARIAAGIIPARVEEHLAGGSVFLLNDMEAAPPFPARARIDLGPL